MTKPKGGKKIRRGKNIQDPDIKLLTATEGQYYGKVTSLLGNARVKVDVFIPKSKTENEHVKKDILGIIRGSMRKRIWVNNGSIVLVSLRDFEKDKVDILYSYKPEQASKLKHKNQLPKSKIFENDENIDVHFDKDDESDEDLFTDKRKNKKESESYSSNFNLIPDSELNLYEDEDEDEEDEGDISNL